jgi:hypothetical protein
LINPLATLVLAAAVFFDARTVVLGSRYDHESQVGEWFRPSFISESVFRSIFRAKPSSADGIVGSQTISIPNAPFEAVLWGSPGIYLMPEPTTSQRLILKDHGLRIVNPDEQSWDEGSRLLEREPGNVLLVMLHHETRLRGFWTPTRRESMCLMHVEYGSDLLPGERIAAIRVAIDAMQRDRVLPDACARLAREGVERETRTHWPGVWHDVASAILAIAFFASLGWLIEVPSWVRAGRARVRASKGLCPACGYDLRGLEGIGCPECGTVMEPTRSLPPRSPPSSRDR